MVRGRRRPRRRVCPGLDPGQSGPHSLNALGWSRWQAAGTRRWPTRYATYVSSMHGWASSLGVTADWLEWLLFHLNGRVDGPREGHDST
ncbi:8-oxoguanine DNA glycosylase OGG fold protein [Streptomyces malaysiensis]|uniref:8-oxoguanine DNA glycosylase OGG fold protein n=1 Tax=Streptomyces malaysiensis TaxID=92644 RepID=UPI00369649C6